MGGRDISSDEEDGEELVKTEMEVDGREQSAIVKDVFEEAAGEEEEEEEEQDETGSSSTRSDEPSDEDPDDEDYKEDLEEEKGGKEEAVEEGTMKEEVISEEDDHQLPSGSKAELPGQENKSSDKKEADQIREKTSTKETREPERIWNPGDAQVALRDILENMMDEFAKDVVRINGRYNEIRGFLIRYFGTTEDGTIFNTFNNNDHLLPEKCSSFFRTRSSAPEPESSVGRALRKRKSRYYDGSDNSSSPERRGSRREEERPERRSRKEQNKGATDRPSLTYPFISQSEEEKIFHNCGGSSSLYAQQVARILFAGSLHLRFKDQDPAKHNWMHEAVDYRFPSTDKATQAVKWKNCSSAINKHMRDFKKDKKEKAVDKDLRYIYLTKEQEMDCFTRAGNDPNKYAEYASFLLFEGSWNKFFKEQDTEKKSWLRECLNKRYPLPDKAARDHRWKICAAACNRNRTKVVGADGKVDPFPYFSQSIEEKCFEEAGGVVATYAEMLSRHLFPDTQHLMFKDQELGKRHWLHHQVDSRYPSKDKLDQSAKWKSITQAINKNMSEATGSASTPVAPADKNGRSERKELIRVRRSEVFEDDTTEPENKRPKRAIKESVKMQEAQADSPPTPKKQKTSVRPFKVEPYSRYPYVSQAKEVEIFENCDKNPQVYAKRLGRLLFEDSLNNYYKDQDPERRQWMREVVDFRFPTPRADAQKQKWKNICAAINKNMNSGNRS